MNYKRLAVFISIFIVIFGVLFSKIELKNKRYHQHREAKVRAEDVVTTDEFATHLPLIEINTEEEMPPPHTGKIIKNSSGDEIEEKNYDVIKSKFKYIQNKDTENKRGDKPVFITNAYIRTRGNSSRYFPKKGYWIEFQNEDYSDNLNIEIDGMVADSDWILHGPYMDKSLIRNYISYNIAGEMMDYSPNVRFCELFLNNEYMGLYVLTEKIGYNKDGRIDITKSNIRDINTSYIIEIDRQPKDKFFRVKGLLEEIGKIYAESSNIMQIVYPNKTLTKEQHYFIEKDIAKIEKTLFSRKILDKRDSYNKYIDVESFIDYYIFNEFAENEDASSLSKYLYKDIRGKVKMIPWDYNNAFDNYMISNDRNRIVFEMSWWYKYLLRDEDFTKKVISRYRYLRKNILSCEYLNNYIDETIEYLGPAIDRNFERWPDSLTYDKLEPKERNQHSHEEAINYLKDIIERRGQFLDKNIITLKRRCHKSITQE